MKSRRSNSFPSWTSRVRSPSPAPCFQVLGNNRKTLVTPFTPFSFQTSPESRVSLLNHLGFEALHCFTLLLKIAMGIDLHAYSQAVPALVGGDLVVDLGFTGQTGVCPAKNLECGPLQSDSLQLRSHLPVPEIVAAKWSVPLCREQIRVRRRCQQHGS